MTDRSATTSRVDAVVEWVLSAALKNLTEAELLTGMIERVTQAGIEVHRINLANRVLHPIYDATGLTWRESTGVELEGFERSNTETEFWLKSPILHMLENGLRTLHLDLSRDEGVRKFPLIAELQSEGITSYFSVMTRFGQRHADPTRQDGIVMSWSTCKPEGWSPQDIADLETIQSTFAVAYRLATRDSLARTVVSAYLGPGAGMRVLDGQIARGDGEDIDAVVTFADLRSSTRLAEELGRDRFLELLNLFFECTALPIQEAGGEILNYIGDAVLAVFPYESFDGPRAACKRALSTALEIRAIVEAANARQARAGKQTIGFGIGMHPGRVMFGNIGIPTRLAFSVTGSAVNEAARITDMCRDLQESIVVSGDFRDTVGGPWRELGEHELRNVSQPVRLYAPA